MNYTLRQLQVFLEVTKQENVTRASEELHMTQPAVSIQLKNFQRQFDIPLTEIIGKRLYVTDFGRDIAAIAKKVLKEADAITYLTKAYQGLLTGTLKISSASTGKYVMPFFLGEFLQQHPGVDLVLDVTNKRKVVNSLSKNEIDFALVSVLPDELIINEERLLENKLYLVGKEAEYYPDAPLIFREKGSATRSAMDNYFSNEFERKSIELTSNEAVKQAIVAGLGYSIIPLIGIRNELTSGAMKIISAPGLPISTTWRLIWHQDKKLTPIAAAYLLYLQENKAALIDRHFKWYLDF